LGFCPCLSLVSSFRQSHKSIHSTPNRRKGRLGLDRPRERYHFIQIGVISTTASPPHIRSQSTAARLASSDNRSCYPASSAFVVQIVTGNLGSASPQSRPCRTWIFFMWAGSIGVVPPSAPDRLLITFSHYFFPVTMQLPVSYVSSAHLK